VRLRVDACFSAKDPWDLLEITRNFGVVGSGNVAKMPGEYFFYL
jgi:hypothetical protein